MDTRSFIPHKYKFSRCINFCGSELLKKYIWYVPVISDGSCRLQFRTLHINTCISLWDCPKLYVACNFRPKLPACTIYTYSIELVPRYYLTEQQRQPFLSSSHSSYSSPAWPTDIDFSTALPSPNSFRITAIFFWCCSVST